MNHKERNDLFLPRDFDHAALMECVGALCEDYPELQFQYLGNSILGRGIPLLTLGTGRREFLYVGAHHGMEWITSLLLVRFVNDLCACRRTGSRPYKLSLELFLQTYRLYIIPMLNPDGVEYQIHGVAPENPLCERVRSMTEDDDFSHWQANARGVDLNHNYDAGFDEYKALERENGIEGGCATRFSGEHPESEPETASLCNFIRFHDKLSGVLTLHTQGEEIFWKSGGITLKGADSAARRLSTLTGYMLSETEGLASYGGLTDWCVQRLGLPSFTIECGRGTNPLPVTDLSPIYSRLRAALFRFPTLL